MADVSNRSRDQSGTNTTGQFVAEQKSPADVTLGAQSPDQAQQTLAELTALLRQTASMDQVFGDGESSIEGIVAAHGYKWRDVEDGEEPCPACGDVDCDMSKGQRGCGALAYQWDPAGWPDKEADPEAHADEAMKRIVSVLEDTDWGTQAYDRIVDTMRYGGYDVGDDLEFDEDGYRVDPEPDETYDEHGDRDFDGNDWKSKLLSGDEVTSNVGTEDERIWTLNQNPYRNELGEWVFSAWDRSTGERRYLAQSEIS